MDRRGRPVDVTTSRWTAGPIEVELDTNALSAKRDPAEPLGTVGVDMFPTGFVLLMHDQRICTITDDDWAWVPLKRVDGSPVVEAREGGKTLHLLLDTGSAAFTLLSTPALSTTVAQSVPGRTLSVPSFGRKLTVIERTPRTVLTLFGRRLALDHVYSFEDKDVEDKLRSAGIDGLIGLSALDDDLALDFANGRIGYRRR